MFVPRLIESMLSNGFLLQNLRVGQWEEITMMPKVND